MVVKFKLEADVDDYVKTRLTELGMKKLVDFNEKSAMSEYLKDALKGSAKTKNKTSFGQPDFHVEKYKVPIIIENKLNNKYHISIIKDKLKMDETSVKNYAVNGAIFYAQNMIASKKYDEVIAIGISGDDEENIVMSTYYVFSSTIDPKDMREYKSLNFLNNFESFNNFYKQATVTEEERHRILISTRTEILKHAKKINILMNNHNIGIEQRVVYVSGMLLSMQDVLDECGVIVDGGLTPEDLKGIQTDQKRDSIIIIKHLEEYLDQKNNISSDKKKIMLDSFKMSISLDSARDNIIELDKSVGKFLKGQCSITKQIFVYLYEFIYKSIDSTNGALDIMAEMYSTFLKYALSDGAPLGKVLTPPYITSLMTRILDVNSDSKVLDVATGSAAFLVAAMTQMINDSNTKFGKGSKEAVDKIETIKKEQLLGIEIDAKMYTLAATNMILRGDGSSQIQKADTFKTPESLYSNFQANILLLNPPFSYNHYGMPFFLFGLNKMEKGGKGAVIIQDSAGSGKAVVTNLQILKKHKMIASIKMPADLFIPNAIVQTSIYVFEAGTPHNFENDIVKFIDFRNDGYKRSERCIAEIDHPAERYSDLYLIYKLGKNAIKNPLFHENLWDINSVYYEDTIKNLGKDWNFEQHYIQKKDIEDGHFTRSTLIQFLWENEVFLNLHSNNDNISFNKLKATFANKKVSDLFTIESVASYNKNNLTKNFTDETKYDYVTRTAENRGICDYTGFIEEKGLCESGVFSLGLLQMTFFYRQNKWYAGQFVRKVKCKLDLNSFSGIFFETILNGLSKKLASALVRDVDEIFLNSEISVPVNTDNEVDFKIIESFIKEKREKFIKSLISKYEKEHYFK